MKTRKSLKDIENEISNIINKSISKTDLITKIETYINNITGKELIPKPFIILKIRSLLNQNNKLNILSKSRIKKLLYIDNKKEDTFSKRISDISKDYFDFEYFQIKSLIASLILNCSKYEKIRNENPNEDIPFYLINDNTLLKLKNFLTKNNDIAELLLEYSIRIQKNAIFERIERKEIPLNAITYYFNTNYDIRENNEYFYKKLNKKHSRDVIQQTLLKWLNEKEKKGKKSSL